LNIVTVYLDEATSHPGFDVQIFSAEPETNTSQGTNVYIAGGNGGGTSGNPGGVVITAGMLGAEIDGTTASTIRANNTGIKLEAQSGPTAGSVEITAGRIYGDGEVGQGGNVAIAGGDSVGDGNNGGNVGVNGGHATGSNSAGGEVNLTGGNGSDGPGGDINISSGDAHGGNSNGGDIQINPGTGAGSGRTGWVRMTSLLVLEEIPSSDPAVAGALWSDSGVVKVSAG
jgi:hypothetical protein